MFSQIPFEWPLKTTELLFGALLELLSFEMKLKDSVVQRLTVWTSVVVAFVKLNDALAPFQLLVHHPLQCRL